MSRITHAQARTIIEAAFAKGRELNLKPLSVVVLDAGGHPVAFDRADGASNMRFQIATGKAGGALSLGVSSRKIGEMAIERSTFISSLASISLAGIIPAAGGVIVSDETGQVIGAVGVTGDTSDNDEICAISGIAAARLNSLD